MIDSRRYDATAYDTSKRLTKRYSTSFGTASRLFDPSVRPHIYAIYGMVRVADEIVDSYSGKDADELLANFKNEVLHAVTRGFSTNPVIHSFALTARDFEIGPDLILPFFDSMTTDLSATHFSESEYVRYIYGSAEVVGLMCLKVFADSERQYDELAPYARLLGSAYQKVNFLRDFADDYKKRGRVYFPNVRFKDWNDRVKDTIVSDIRSEFDRAEPGILRLPISCRTAVYVSYLYYDALLNRLERMSAEEIIAGRAHVPSLTKLALLITAPLGSRFS